LKKRFIAPVLVFCWLIQLGPSVLSCPQAEASNQQSAKSQTPTDVATLHGRVIDAHTGEPIAKVRVIVAGTDEGTSTDEKGEFSLTNLPPGQVDLYITTVSYGLVKKSVVLKTGDNPEKEIALNEDAAALTEKVSIALDPFEGADTNIPSEQMLNKRELQSLSSVLIGDPVRAAQALPGVATGDDFRSEFSVRGAGFERVGLYLDGVLTDNFVHTIQGGYLDTGSLSVINADTVSSISLFSGAFPAKYGDRTGGILDVTTREGNRIKPTGRISAALSGLSGTVDGPLANGKASYLIAARKSYVGYLIRKLNDQNHFANNPPILNFADFHAKASYDVTKRNQFDFSIIYGELKFDRNQDRDLLFPNTVFRGSAKNLLINGQWSYTPNPRLFWQTRVFTLRTDFTNTNRYDAILDDGNRSQYGFRSDLNLQVLDAHRIGAGVYVRRLAIDSLSQAFFSSQGIADSMKFQQEGTEQSYYAQDTVSSERQRLSLTGGARVEHSDRTRQTLFSPRASLSWSMSKLWQLRAGAGRYYQFPDLEQMFGRLGNSGLLAERATHYNAGIERRFGDRMRVLAEVYDRRDDNLFFGISEPRLVGNSISFIQFPFRNSLNGYARGLELTLQRRSANKLAGWISYAYSRTRLTDSQTGLSFVSDTDQRHTANVYGSYRFTDTLNLTGEWRYGSGQPIPGFFRQVGPDYFLSDQRNQARVPDYSRADIRLSKAFLFNRWKLTVTGEVINVLNRTNLRYEGFFVFGVDGRIFEQLHRLLPILPSAGVIIEF